MTASEAFRQVTATDGARMAKRIIDGKTYNTETATKIDGWDERPDEYPISYGEHLYQNRFGAFFLHSYQDDGPNGPEEELKPYTPEQARQWLEKYRSWRIDIFEQLFGKMPEAGSGETKFTLRMPDSLRDRLAERAKAADQSLNAWIIRCLEAGAMEAGPELSTKGEQKGPFVNKSSSNSRNSGRKKGTAA